MAKARRDGQYAESIFKEPLLEQAESLWRACAETGWSFARVVADIIDQRAYAPKYKSIEQWGVTRLQLGKSTLLRYARAARFVKDRPDIERWYKVPVFCAIEVMDLASRDAQKALELAESGATQAQLRQKVKEAEPDQHHDTTGYAKITATVTQGTRNEWVEACNLIRVHLGQGGTKYPTDNEIISAIALTVKQAPELRGDMTEMDWCAALSGEARCYRCGSYCQLHRHHVAIRSKHKGGKDIHGVERLVYLCAECHYNVHHHREDESWRKLADELGIEVAP